MNVLTFNENGPDVVAWQNFLVGQRYQIVADGQFGRRSTAATKDWQAKNGLVADGIVGAKSYAVASSQGFAFAVPSSAPARPSGFSAYVSNREREVKFGKFSYVWDPAPDNPEQIRVTDDWADDNLVQFVVPLLINQKLSKTGKVTCHKLFASAVGLFFSRVEEAGLADRILTWDGCYVPRYIRGSRQTLSNHAWGTAFDINADWNPLGHQSAPLGAKGCVYELVPIAIDCGLFWGQWFNGRADGMHFELARTV
jgi:hypothetical protein